jgi:transmembrane sensor
MNELLTRYFCGTITLAEKEQLFAAIDNDSELKEEFEFIQNLRGLTAWIPDHKDKSDAIERLLDFKQKQSRKNKLSTLRLFIRYAVVALVCVGCTWYLSSRQPKQSTGKSALAYEEISTPPGQRTLVSLQDGSKVWLNASTTLRYPSNLGNGNRHVALDGEAYFEVKHDAQHPFTIATNKAKVSVLGTKFSVFAYKENSNFSVSLLEGSVRVSKNGDATHVYQLMPNQKFSLCEGNVQMSFLENQDFLLWKDGIYSFDDVRFTQIVEKLELYFDIKIILKNTKLANYRFSGKFRQRDGVENILKTLRQVYPFKYTKDDARNRILIP